jgi:mannose-6-phosphate isomerase-like protein (cupin superfamily)
MDSYTKVNLDNVKDLAPEFGMGEMGEARFAREALGARRIGLAHYRMNAGRRVGFGHRHGESEELYVVIGGSGSFKVDDDVFPVAERDVVYCRPTATREWEAGAAGLELLAFGGHAEDDVEMEPGWWAD